MMSVLMISVGSTDDNSESVHENSANIPDSKDSHDAQVLDEIDIEAKRMLEYVELLRNHGKELYAKQAYEQ
jgi:hypothetical protein